MIFTVHIIFTSDLNGAPCSTFQTRCVLAGLACLHLAALNRQHHIMKLLMKKGADLNIQVSLSNDSLFN